MTLLENQKARLFFLIWKSQGPLAAFNETRLFIMKKIYYKLGINNFLMFYLNTGKPSIFWALYKNIFTKILELEIGEGIEIMSEDWDNLIILDAYRSDFFKKYSQLEGEFTEKVSKGDHSHEFVKKNFRGEFWDTVLITANVWYEKSPFIGENTFFKMVNPVSNERFEHRLVSDAVVEEIKNHPDKRVIIHYMSPHAPFEGIIAEDLAEPPWGGECIKCSDAVSSTRKFSESHILKPFKSSKKKLKDCYLI